MNDENVLLTVKTIILFHDQWHYDQQTVIGVSLSLDRDTPVAVRW